MTKSNATSRIARAVTLIALVAVVSVLAGCGSKSSSSGSSGSSGSTAVSKDAAVAAKVPPALASGGTLTVALDASYPPNEYLDADGKTIVGMDADLSKAIAQTMGLKSVLKNVTFDAILPGLAANKYDVGISSFTDTKEREKTVDFVTYLTAGTKFYTTASGGKAVNGSLDGLCGLSVAAEKGTTQASDAQAQSKKCTSAGKGAVNVSVFPDQNAANLAVSSGRADVGMADAPVALDIVNKSGGKLKITGVEYGKAPYGIAINKKSGLQDATLAAVQSLISSGKYAEILKKWGQSGDAIASPQLNGATS